MHLKLAEELQKMVKQVLTEERLTESLRSEVNRVLGPAVVATGSLHQIAEATNDRLDVLERTGRASRLAFRPSVMVGWLGHSDPEVRKFATRVVPEKFLSRMVNDKNDTVRAAAARRLPLRAVSEMLKRFPKDDQVRVIYREKKLQEAGIAQPKVQDEPFDMYGDDRLGDATRTDTDGELSERWYREQAFKFMQDYGTNIEDGWESIVAHRFAISLKVTSGIEIDEEKLFKAIRDLIEEREDRAMERSALKETLSHLKRRRARAALAEAVMPIIGLDVDPVRELLEGNLPPSTYIDQANSLFKVQEATVPGGIRKHRLGERARASMIPVIARVPHPNGPRAIDERALDTYCRHWNDRQATAGEPFRIGWSNHPDQVNKVSFNVTLR